MTEPSLQEIRSLARDFAAAELRPRTEAWDHAGAFEPAVLGQLAELGFLGMLVPEADGGLGFTLPQYAAVLEELAWGEPGLALAVAETTLVSALVAEAGAGTARGEWLGRLTGGEVVGTRALAEPDGADAGPATGLTRARQEGDGWVLAGRKAIDPGAPAAGVLAVLAATGENETALFLVATDAAGVEVTVPHGAMGLRSLGLAEVGLQDARVDGGARLGSGGMAALAAVGPTARVAYADEREQFGQALRSFEGIQFKLADMAARVSAARAVTMAAAAAPDARSAAEAKLTASTTAMVVTTEAVQIFGGYGYMRDYPVEKLMRDAKATEVLEGSSEFLRVEIARGLYAS